MAPDALDAALAACRAALLALLALEHPPAEATREVFAAFLQLARAKHDGDTRRLRLAARQGRPVLDSEAA